MAGIDLSFVTYNVNMITEAGDIYDLTDAVTSLSWEEQEGQLAQRTTLELASETMVNDDYLSSLLKINRILQVYADWGIGKQKVFEGIIWEWKYTHSEQKELHIIAYDPMIRLQQSRDFKYFTEGLDTQTILQEICDEWGIPLNYKWGQSITHEKKVFNGEAISDMITELLDEVRKQSDRRYIVLYRDGSLEVNGYGNNTDVYVFNTKNTFSTSDSFNMDNLVTRVKVMGKSDDDERSSVDAVVDGNLEFGILQEIVQRDSDKDLSEAQAEADTILNERGKPEEEIIVNVPDLPFLRKGDAVEMAAGNLLGTFLTLGVTHNAAEQTMTLTLLRQTDTIIDMPADESGEGGESGGGSDQPTEDFKQGDEVILNGPVYRDSNGNGQGRSFSDYRSTITIVTSLDKPCPYHIGEVGWVYPSEITRA